MASSLLLEELNELLSIFDVEHQSLPSFPRNLSIGMFDKSASKELQQIDVNVKLTVIGFVKSIQGLISNQIIPTTIVYICVQYYGYNECFEAAGNSIVISGNDHLDIKKQKLRDNGIINNINWRCQSVFGQKTINSFNNQSTCRWTIKINQGGSGVFVFGLAANFEQSDVQSRFYDKPNNYGFNIYNGRKVSNNKFDNYGDRCGSNDVITMEVNFREATIIYFVNNRSQGTAFEHIEKDKNIHYKLAITLQEPHDGCSLIGFEKI